MKKILFAVLALAALVSCTNDQTLDVSKQAIGFGNIFVDNATRIIDTTYDDDTFVDEFKVWGTVKGGHDDAEVVTIFEGATVSRPTGLSGYNPEEEWECSEVRYWAPNATYEFVAVVDGGLERLDNGKYNLVCNIIPDQKDILWATATVTTDANANPSTPIVAFTFNHALAKAFFTFKTNAAFGTEDYTYEISDIKFKSAYTRGQNTIGTNGWIIDGEPGTQAPLSFGAAVTLAPSKTAAVAVTSEYARVFIPSANMNVSFTVSMKFKGSVISKKDYQFGVFPSYENKHAQAGHQYNFVVEFTESNQVKFAVSDVTDWINGDAANGDSITLQ